MGDLVRFMHRDDLSVLLHAAVTHAQFLTIHPFVDGNGRTGRALAHSLLKNKGLVASSVVPISAGLLVNLRRYFSALSAFREGDAGPIIREFAGATRIAVTAGTELVDQLVREMDASQAALQGVRSDAAAWRVLAAMLGQPVVTTTYLMGSLGLGEMAALRALDTLTTRGVLTEITGRTRSRVWQHDGFLGALDDFAERIRRMSSR